MDSYFHHGNRTPNAQRHWCASKWLMTKEELLPVSTDFNNEINRNTIREIHLQINSRRETNANEPFPTSPWLISHVGKGHTVRMQMNEGSFIMSMIELRWPNTDGFSLRAARLACYADVICGPEIGPAGLIRSARAPGCHSQPQRCRLRRLQGRRHVFVQAAADWRLSLRQLLQKASWVFDFQTKTVATLLAWLGTSATSF